MTLSPSQQAELRDLVDAVCENELTAASVQRLENLLLADDDACRYYLDYLSLHGAMLLTEGSGARDEGRRMVGSPTIEVGSQEWRADGQSEIRNQKSETLGPESPVPIPPSPFPNLSFLHSPLFSSYVGSWPFGCVATVIMGVAILGAWAYKITHYQQIARSSSPSLSAAIRREMTFVGRITGMIDCRWADPKTEPFLGAYVPLGRKYALASGRIEITYDTGAKVILQGPCIYEVESRNSGYLALGKLTARVTKDKETRRRGGKEKRADAASPPLLVYSPPGLLVSPLFSVRTPTGKIVDLGTEFGLSVEPTGKTEVVVFDGAVDFQYRRPTDPGSSGQIAPRLAMWYLVKGEALCVDLQGVANRIVTVHSGRFPQSVAPEAPCHQVPAVIESVTDNIHSSDAMPFYQIVREGFGEDVLAYVDRKHEWNGVDASGIPSFLHGADYVMSFNSDRFRGKFEMSVRIACSADVYIFWDERLPVAAWLSERFTNTGYKIGIDETRWRDMKTGKSRGRSKSAAVGPGKSIDNLFSIWKLHVPEPETLTFGPLMWLPGMGRANMYGIAAVCRWANANKYQTKTTPGNGQPDITIGEDSRP